MKDLPYVSERTKKRWRDEFLDLYWQCRSCKMGMAQNPTEASRKYAEALLGLTLERLYNWIHRRLGLRSSGTRKHRLARLKEFERAVRRADAADRKEAGGSCGAVRVPVGIMRVPSKKRRVR